MALSSSSSLPDADEAGLSPAIFSTSIVVAVILSALTSSLITSLATHFLCVKGKRHQPSNEVSGHTKKETSQPAALYEEVNLADQTHKVIHDSMETTSNIAYGRI